MSENRDIRVVVAIDFGTTYSGFAYAHRSSCQYIVTNESWEGCAGQFKIPTVLQYDENLNIKSWGYIALAQKPARKIEVKTKPAELFKLYLGKLAKKPPLPEGLDYKKAITDYLYKMGEKIRETLNAHWQNLDVFSQVLFILTIPAEFDARDISIMRECAVSANLINELSSRNLIFMTEPEAAAIQCIETLKEHELGAGSTYMIVDCGGGTVDLTVRKFLISESLSELTERSGDFGGSTFVDREFNKFLSRKIGESALENLTENYYCYLQNLIQEFCRQVKLPFTGDPSTFESVEFDLEKFIPNIKTFVTGKKKEFMEKEDWLIEPNFEEVKEMFDPVITKIISLIHDQLSVCENCSAMFLVGGFSESQYLQIRIKEEFKQKVKIISVPTQPITAILKGAVKFGLKEDIISERVLKWTYGTPTIRRWESTDPEDRILSGGLVQTFQTLVTKGSRVFMNEKIVTTFIPASLDQKQMTFDIYVTSKDNAKYCDEDGVELLGNFFIDLPSDGDYNDKTFLLTLEFGKIEILATAVNKHTGQKFKTNFLLDI
ncbi:actin-like ATPase domain-containing protein [Gigaspora margarita]|uniref:Actin-like ATPase domain-containing protein n=1 Tax=Gigaspora margarita TaxID=4874 RepID=A0A8H4B1S8_GIGMA|nr:actin-like ATPase domain-containing protein [Gigaspora margarita]